MTDTFEALALPHDGVDLRAEIDALQRARVRQALERARGNLGEAARLLRVTRSDLSRMQERIAGAKRARPGVDPESIPRIAGGLELVSAAVIRRYAAEGLSERQIAKRLGVNVFLVERCLERHTASEVERLDAEGLSFKAIALKLRITIQRVASFVKAADDRRAEAACSPRKRGP